MKTKRFRLDRKTRQFLVMGLVAMSKLPNRTQSLRRFWRARNKYVDCYVWGGLPQRTAFDYAFYAAANSKIRDYEAAIASTSLR
jgi:hypothetical protein